MPTSPIATLEAHFSVVEDPRTEYLVEHSLVEMIIIAICAVICGAENWVDVANWGQEKTEWLKDKGLELANGMPSHDTFRRVFLRLDPEQFQTGFAAWIQAVFEITKGQVICIDGKQMKGSKSKKLGTKAICMISAWATQNRIVLGQRKAEEKSNEISAIPELLKLLDVSGCLVTIDAAGCQKENARLIVDGGGDYLLATKGNQGNLHDDVSFIFERAHKNEFKGIEADYVRMVSQGHGHIEIRECWIIDDEKELAFIRDRQAWKKLQTIVMIRSIRQEGEKITENDMHFICSTLSDARSILEAKRDHWLIENDLHWSLDVAFDEDRHQLRGDGAANMAVVRHVALSLLKQEKTDRCGIKGKRLKAAWSTSYLERVLQPN